MHLRNLDNSQILENKNMANPPFRSISLPSREHPCSVRIEALLNHLKSFQFSPPAAYESEIIQSSLVGLAELYNCVEEFMNSPSTQQALTTAKHAAGKLVERALEGSIALLDSCNMAREILMTMKEHVQTLQSALRRKGCGRDSSIESTVHAYLSFRKKAKKDIAKCLGGLKRIEIANKVTTASSPPLDLSQDLLNIVKILGETSDITVSVFWSLLKFLSVPTSSATKAKGWSLISKLVRTRLVPFEKEESRIVNLAANIDISLQTLLGNMQSNEVRVAQNMLATLDLSSEGLVAGLDCMFRCLVQNRVSLLNILTQ